MALRKIEGLRVNPEQAPAFMPGSRRVDFGMPFFYIRLNKFKLISSEYRSEKVIEIFLIVISEV